MVTGGGGIDVREKYSIVMQTFMRSLDYHLNTFHICVAKLQRQRKNTALLLLNFGSPHRQP
jgi:hypothetical protein